VGLGAAEISRLKAMLAQAKKGDPNVSGVQSAYDSLYHIAGMALTEDPDPIDTLRTEGLLQGDPRKTATWLSIKDMHKMYALAVVYKVEGSSKYLDKLKLYLKAWATHNISRGDPIDETNLDDGIAAFDMIKDKLTEEDLALVDNWLSQVATTEINAVFNRPGRGTSHNNWHSHRIKIIGEIAFALGDTVMENYCITALKRQIGTNLKPDGSSADFKERDALHYHIYDLEPLITISRIIQMAKGTNYYSWVSPSGSSIKGAVGWVLPYLRGDSTHAEYVNSTVEFDRQRAKNGEAGFKTGALFNPVNGVSVLILGACFDPSLLVVARKILGTTDQYPTWEAVVSGLMRKP
jgi:hypothetical protein